MAQVVASEVLNVWLKAWASWRLRRDTVLIANARSEARPACGTSRSTEELDGNTTTKKGTAVDIDKTLQERGNRYGKFDQHARITQSLKRAMQDSPNWQNLKDDQKEALEMVVHKIGRILNGDPDYHDSWHDIIGYTKLVADTLVTPNA